MRIGWFDYPAEPTLDDGEELVATFAGLRGRVTLTDARVIVSRRRHRSIPYVDVVDVDGGTFASPNWFDYRDNVTIMGGIYLCTLDWSEEWVHVPNGSEAATLIRQRAPNLAPVGEKMTRWIEELKARRELAAAAE